MVGPTESALMVCRWTSGIRLGDERAAWSGHKTLSEVARYTQAADQAAMAKAAAIKMRTSLSNAPAPSVKQ